MSNILVSTTAEQHGYGSDPYKHVSRLTKEEQEHVKKGGIVIFKSERKSGGLYHGTYWRVVRYHRKYGYFPRVASPEDVKAMGFEY